MSNLPISNLTLLRLRRISSRLAANLVAGIALAALAGWLLGYSRFPQSLRRSVPMHPTTALLLLAAAAALWLCGGKRSLIKTRVGMGLAAVIFVGGLVRLLFLSSLPIFEASTATRFTMAPLTSMNLMFYGAAFFTIHCTRGKSKLLIYLLGFVPALTSLLTISKCIFVNLAPQSWGQQPFPIALSAATSFLLLTAGIALELLRPSPNASTSSNNRQDPSLANELACGFGAAFFLLCGVGIFSYQSIAEFLQDSYWDNSSWQVSAAIDKLHAALIEDEISESGVDLPGNLTAHLPVNAATAIALANLQTLSQDDPLSQQQFKLLKPLIQKIFQGGQNLDTTQQIHGLLDRMSTSENKRLTQRLADTHINIRRGVVLISLSALFALALVIAAGWMLNRDIGGRERAQELLRSSEELFRGLLQSAPDAMVITSRNGDIELINVRAEELFGYSAEELVGQPVSVILPGGVPQGERLSTELSGVRKDGSRFPAEMSLGPVRTLGGQSVSHAIRDVTRQKDEEHRLAYLNSALSESNTQLEAANKELESFSYSVSHDLRAPLRSIDGFSQAILDDYGDKLDDEGRDHLQRVRAATQRMGQLIDDLLNLSRVTRAEMNREQVDLSTIARDIAEELRTTVPEHDVDFVVSDNVSAYTDARLVRILLTNLLSNAWKFTAKKPRAHIEFGCVGENGKTEFFVSDNGAGFDPAHSARLFGAFQRLHSVTEYAGTGIGLATAHRIVRRQGGNIWAEGRPNEGATFRFTL